MSTDRKHSKLGRSIISLCCAAACVVGGFAMGSNIKTSAQAESAPAAETSSYVSPVQNVAANCIDSVVGVITSVEQWNPSSGSLEGTEAGEGSGVIISADGYIVTNNHVIANGTSYQVRLSDGTVVDATLKMGGIAMITADHGNAEQMKEPDGSPMTAHTTNPVPFILCGAGSELRPGRLADIAPTILDVMGLACPPEMDGQTLIVK